MLNFSEYVSEDKGPKQAEYHKGVEDEEDERVDQFKRQAKMDDDDPKAYKDAPGDKEAREKGIPKSKHTKNYEKMFEEKVPEHGLTRLGKNKGSVKRLVKKHLGANAAEKITASDGEAIMNIAKEKDDEELRKRGSFIKNFYGESLLPSFSTYLAEGYGDKGIRKKAKETGISYSILKKVYDRGVAAWKTGHRPGTTPQQWGYARVNSFATGGKTRRTADKDLWKKHLANKKKKKKKTKKEEVIMEAEYKGRKVKLNDPVRLPSGNKKKFKVYTTHPKTGNVIKVQFGDPGLSIKRDSDKRRKAFRARHGCDAVTYEDDRHTPKYWSCKMWEKDKKVSELD